MSLTLLAIETCSEACSIALLIDGKVSQLVSNEPRGHADHVLPFVEKLLRQADISLKNLDAIAFTRGPGAFTGVRIGTSVAQGLALSSNLPLIAVSSLAVLAQTSYRHTDLTHCIPALDARMSEVYVGFYQLDNNDCMVELENDQVAPALDIACSNEQNIIAQSDHWQGYGPGWTNYPDQMQQRFSNWKVAYPEGLFFPEALDLLTLAEAQYQDGKLLDPAEAMPVYVRDKVVRG
ncbi:MAG: tRNA (adenosine(37)-N6)-threonylcarbamoyltransferase complex dimerization subunit type 1 TsaB [Gammaproteobacteria bacterium]|nr:MAG: tRNA (adenosine(37)-N6)-threonylcarbamoyltransferase complex dimerization subunit type 1 TsaB [Gammaproteobacteria bacterium]